MERYEKIDQGSPDYHRAGGSKAANRKDFYGDAWRTDRALMLRLLSAGDFVSRLWARFGEPHSVGYEGFTYCLRDRETGLSFQAYCAGSGPAYGTSGGRGKYTDAPTLDALRAFETWIAATPPADCVIRFDDDFGTSESGAKGGVPFERRVKKKRAAPP